MILSGWRPGAKTIDAVQSVRRHTGMSLKESKHLVDEVLEGKPRKLPDDFVLREELESMNFILE